MENERDRENAKVIERKSHFYTPQDTHVSPYDFITLNAKRKCETEKERERERVKQSENRRERERESVGGERKTDKPSGSMGFSLSNSSLPIPSILTYNIRSLSFYSTDPQSLSRRLSLSPLPLMILLKHTTLSVFKKPTLPPLKCMPSRVC